MPLRSDLLQPLEGENPAGVNVRYEPVFDQIKIARIEEPELPQGEWQRERKTADYNLVVKLAGDVLATRSKDLWVAAWLTEGLTRREGIPGLRSCLELLHALLEGFWDHLYPEIDEDGDLELRVAPLEWVGRAGAVCEAVKSAPLTEAGYGFHDYRQSREVGYEADARQDPAKHEAWKAAVAGGKVSADAFDRAFGETGKSWYRALAAELDGSLASLEALDRVCEERFGNLAPGYLDLRDAITEVRQVAGQLLKKKLEADPDPVESAPAAEALPEPAPEGESPGAAPAAASAPAPAAMAATAGPVPQGREDAAARIAAAARYLRRESPGDPAPYLMVRGFRWGELRAQGATVDPKLLVAPPTEVRARLKGHLLDGRWAELLEEAEEVMAAPHGRGWLDLQRYVAAACEGLGSEYDPVAVAVRSALRSLLQDLPQLAGLTLMDDSPVANAETRQWMQEQGILGASAGDVDVVSSGTDGGPLDRLVARARAEEPHRAIDLLMRAAAQERSPRARFLRRSQAAEIMLEVGLQAVAMPILREMLEQVESHKLEQWEAGDTIARTLGLAYRCMEKLEPGNPSGRESLYLKVCRLDPMQAILLTRDGGNGGSGS